MRVGALQERYWLYGVEDTAEVSDYVDSPDDFFFLTSFVSAQSKAPSVDNFIARRIGGKIIPASDARGDVHIVDDTFFPIDSYIELKTSTTNVANNLNARQIRPWQPVDYYILSYINEYDLPSSVLYLLTHDEMLGMCSQFGGASHGTHDVASINEYTEISITIPVYNPSSAITQAFAPYRNEALLDRIIGYSC